MIKNLRKKRKRLVKTVWTKGGNCGEGRSYTHPLIDNTPTKKRKISATAALGRFHRPCNALPAGSAVFEACILLTTAPRWCK
jgi:hypothetical protein